MRLKFRTKTLLAAAGVLLMLMAAPLGLRLVMAAQDAARFARPHTRELGAGEPAPEAEAIPLVASLWDKALYYEGSEYQAADWNRPDGIASHEEYRSRYNRLQMEQVLPGSALYHAYSPEDDIPCDTEALYFTRVGELLLYQNELAVTAYAYINRVVAETVSLPDSCHAYVSYLGLSALEDWETAAWPTVEGLQIAALYSPGAQLLVQVTLDTRSPYDDIVTMSCGVYPLSREAFAEQTLAE